MGWSQCGRQVVCLPDVSASAIPSQVRGLEFWWDWLQCLCLGHTIQAWAIKLLHPSICLRDGSGVDTDSGCLNEPALGLLLEVSGMRCLFAGSLAIRTVKVESCPWPSLLLLERDSLRKESTQRKQGKGMEAKRQIADDIICTPVMLKIRNVPDFSDYGIPYVLLLKVLV